ncbi:hypothetical protein ACWF9B_32965 [Streptomyces sp. NPDC055089]
MSESNADLPALLRELDEPEWLERSKHYDRDQAAMHFGVLVARFEEDFAARCTAVLDSWVSCTAEQDTQESSEYGRVVVPGVATVCGVSKFGLLALVCADNPGAFFGTADAQAEGELDTADLAKVNRALVELGYVVAAEELLESDYDGPSRLPAHVQRPSWWHRFFGIF